MGTVSKTRQQKAEMKIEGFVHSVPKLIALIIICVSLATCWFFSESNSTTIERRYTHCYPVMKFEDSFKIMKFEEKCEERKYTIPKEEQI